MTLAWDANPEFGIAGYLVYVRSSADSRSYDVAGATSFTLRDAVVGTQYHFAVAAYTRERLVGDRSAELSALATMPGTCRANPAPVPPAVPGAPLEFRSRATGLGRIASLTESGDDLAVVEDNRRVRYFNPAGLGESALPAADASTRFTEVALPPQAPIDDHVYLGRVVTRSGVREFEIVRYRKVGHQLGQGATIIAGLRLPGTDDPRFTVNRSGLIYVAMPAAPVGRTDPYAARVLRFTVDGTVPSDSRHTSPIMAHGFERPRGLFADGRLLWLSGEDPRWSGGFATLPEEEADTDPWPRVPIETLVAPPPGPPVDRKLLAFAAREGLVDEVVLLFAEPSGVLSRVRVGADGTQTVDAADFGASRAPVAAALGEDLRVYVAVPEANGRFSILESSPAGQPQPGRLP
jgi:hypothetical protein